MNPPFEVTILGSSSASPTKTRHHSAQFVSLDGSHFLVDCGEGAQRQLLLHGIRFSRIRYILISHLHGDHFFGLPGLLSTMNLGGRTEPLLIAGPAGLQGLMEQMLSASHVELKFELSYLITNPEASELLLETAQCSVHSIPLEHRIPCTGFIFREKTPLRHLNREACDEHRIPVSAYEALLAGEDFVQPDGIRIPNNVLTNPGRAPRSYAYISDTIYLPDLAKSIRGVDLLYHEATFMHDLLDRAVSTFHTTAKQAALLAHAAEVKQLLIGHFSARYRDTEGLLAEAQEVFPATAVAEEGLTFRF
ncbi:MAG: ribonuclease Z [Bacteroidetes bacterium]|nr:ribonuclease Z [Bacteroidota bacterium]